MFAVAPSGLYIALGQSNDAHIMRCGGGDARDVSQMKLPITDSPKKKQYYLRAVEDYQWTAFLSISSEHSKPYMILKALCKGFQEIYRFAMLRSRGKEWQLREVTL